MIPYVRDLDFEYGRAEHVSPLIRRVIARNPGPFTYLGTGTYIIGHGEVAVIDPGPALAEHLDAILAAVAGERVTAILLTHHHSDHSPLAGPLKARTRAPVYGCPLAAPVADDPSAVRMEADHDQAFAPDFELCAGGRIAGPGWTLEAIPTPGHTSNHISYALEEENALFTGDHIMGWSTTIIAPPDGDMTAYMASLERVRAGGYATLWPTHGPPVRDVAPFLDAYVAHRLERQAQILRALETAPARIPDLVPQLYADVDPRLHPAAARSMLAAMIDLVRRGLVRTEGDPGPASEYRLG